MRKKLNKMGQNSKIHWQLGITSDLHKFFFDRLLSKNATKLAMLKNKTTYLQFKISRYEFGDFRDFQKLKSPKTA